MRQVQVKCMHKDIKSKQAKKKKKGYEMSGNKIEKKHGQGQKLNQYQNWPASKELRYMAERQTGGEQVGAVQYSILWAGEAVEVTVAGKTSKCEWQGMK